MTDKKPLAGAVRASRKVTVLRPIRPMPDDIALAIQRESGMERLVDDAKEARQYLRDHHKEYGEPDGPCGICLAIMKLDSGLRAVEEP